LPRTERLRLSAWAGWIALTTIAFIQPLWGLLLLASENELHSHIPLIPFVAAYLLVIQRRTLPAATNSSIGASLMIGAVGCTAIAARMAWSEQLSTTDGLALMALAFVSIVAAGGFLFLGSNWMAASAFPISFLIFIVPMPDAVANALEIISMRASADVAAWLFTITGTPLLRDGEVFALPGIVLRVAQECSGIRSSWVLVITSLLASHLFLKSGWRRIVLVAFVIPLGIVRNGFRILVIGLLCVHVGPQMIDSAIHHQGGPLFFLLSLGPLFLFLWWLRRREQ